jgi:hypothetical protein
MLLASFWRQKVTNKCQTQRFEDMEEKNLTGTIPAQHDGEVINAEHVRELPDEAAAVALFQTARTRLLDVNNWNAIAVKLLAKFQLTDQAGSDIQGPAREGDYFKIDIAGPGTEAGEGYDWVRIEQLETYLADHAESIGMRVRPAPNPANNNPDTAHFYTDDSTSTFTITREYNKVTAAVYDRNIKVNSSSDHLTERIRNSLVGLGGKLIFSKAQWEYLASTWVKT